MVRQVAPRNAKWMVRAAGDLSMTQQRKSELDASLRRLAKNDPRLRELSLSWTGIGDWGLEALSDVLKVNTVLTSLDLYHNDIGPRGAGALARALWRNRTLIDVNLDSNNIGDEGVGDFIYTMEEHNTTLTNLKVQNNHVDQIKLRDLNDLLERNTAHKASAQHGQGFNGYPRPARPLC
jgi:Ran GTPase-activating protein (RanGAP) involved in mRNA processing and transport